MPWEDLPQVHFPAFPMSVRRAVFVSTVSPGLWVATKESPFEFLQVDAPSWFVSSMKSPNDVGIPGVVLKPLFWVVGEPVESLLFLAEVKGILGALSLLWRRGLRAGGGFRGQLLLLRIHHAPNTMIATRKATSATSRPGRFFLGGCGGRAVARLLLVAGVLVVAHSCLPVSRSGLPGATRLGPSRAVPAACKLLPGCKEDFRNCHHL